MSSALQRDLDTRSVAQEGSHTASGSTGGSRQRSPVERFGAWLGLGYGIVSTLLVLLGRAFGDVTWWLFLFHLLAFYLLLPAVPLLAVAVVRRWWLPALSCATAAVLWLVTFAPLFIGQSTPDGDTVRVASYNISPRPDIAHVERMVTRTAPEVLLLQEVLPSARDDLQRALPDLSHTYFAPVSDIAPGGGGTAVFSRYPIASTAPVTGLPRGARPTAIVTVDTPDGPLDVLSLHLTSPCRPCLTDGTQRERLEAEARQRAAEGRRIAQVLPDDGVVVGGDLNSTTLHQPRRSLLGAGLRDLHQAVGAGPGFTRLRGTGLVRIDWLFASPDLTPVREWVDERDGSEHRPVVADIVVAR